MEDYPPTERRQKSQQVGIRTVARDRTYGFPNGRFRY
jgi:hypothetical protein